MTIIFRRPLGACQTMATTTKVQQGAKQSASEAVSTL